MILGSPKKHSVKESKERSSTEKNLLCNVKVSWNHKCQLTFIFESVGEILTKEVRFR